MMTIMGDEELGREIGRMMKQLRRSQKMTLKDTATRAGVSESFLSQVERGKASPSLATLLRIAAGLGEPLEYFFRGENPSGKIVRSSSQRHLEHPGGWQDYLLTPPSAEEVHLVHSVIEPGHGSGDELYVHDAKEEVIFIIEGSLQVVADGETHYLATGDTLVLNPREPHGFKNISARRCRSLWIMGQGTY